MREPDPLERLADLWRAATPPAAPDAGIAGEDAVGGARPVPDPATERALEWTRAAWRALEPPAVYVPADLARPRARSLRRALAGAGGLRLAAAAVLFATLALALSAPRFRRTAGGGTGSPGTAPIAVTEHPWTPPPARAAWTPNSFELRSGPVRLILLDPPEPDAGSPTQEQDGR